MDCLQAAICFRRRTAEMHKRSCIKKTQWFFSLD